MRYVRVINCKYYPFIGYHNDQVIVNFIYYGTYYVEYEHKNITIIDGNVTKMLLVIYKGEFSDIDSEDTLYHRYYIIRFTSNKYTLKEDFNIDGEVISSSEIVCEYEGTYFFH